MPNALNEDLVIEQEQGVLRSSSVGSNPQPFGRDSNTSIRVTTCPLYRSLNKMNKEICYQLLLYKFSHQTKVAPQDFWIDLKSKSLNDCTHLWTSCHICSATQIGSRRTSAPWLPITWTLSNPQCPTQLSCPKWTSNPQCPLNNPFQNGEGYKDAEFHRIVARYF